MAAVPKFLIDKLEGDITLEFGLDI